MWRETFFFAVSHSDVAEEFVLSWIFFLDLSGTLDMLQYCMYDIEESIASRRFCSRLWYLRRDNLYGIRTALGREMRRTSKSSCSASWMHNHMGGCSASSMQNFGLFVITLSSNWRFYGYHIEKGWGVIIEKAAQHIRQTENQLRFIYYWVPGGASYKISMMQHWISAEVRIGSQEIYISGRASYKLMQCMLQGEHDANACFRESMLQLDNMFSRES